MDFYPDGLEKLGNLGKYPALSLKMAVWDKNFPQFWGKIGSLVNRRSGDFLEMSARYGYLNPLYRVVFIPSSLLEPGQVK